MRNPDSTRSVSIAFANAVVFVVLAGCSKKEPLPSPSRPDVKVGTVRARLSSPNPCPAAGSCTLYPDQDTTVYASVAKDFGQSHELCVGAGGNNGLARALLHFNMGDLPAHFFATAASLTVSGRRGAPSGSLSIFRLVDGPGGPAIWSEGDGGPGAADG